MPRKANSDAQSLQKHRLTLAQLASYDDVLTDALVDQAYFWSRIRKNRENKYLPVRGIKQDEVPQILLHHVIIAKDVESAERALLNLVGLRRYIGGLRTEPEKKDFLHHLRKYVNVYLPDCPFEVSTTNRYTVTAHEAAITARRKIREGDKIRYLCGTLVPLTDAELKDLDLTQRNFSIVQSDRRKNTLIFLGPARFANHDCAANGRLVSVGKDGLEVHATRNIQVGEEITVTYSPGYFGANNEECLCHTCELQARNGWTAAEAAGSTRSSESTPAPRDSLSDTQYSFRKKRKHGVDSEPGYRDRSPSFPKKQKQSRPPSRLNQVLTPPPSSRSLEVDVLPRLSSDHENLSMAPLRSLQEVHHADEDSCLSDAGTPGVDSANVVGSLIVSNHPTQKKIRLIDQMTSSTGSSPETLATKMLCSSASDESESACSLSKTSVHGTSSTRATTLTEAGLAVKVESSEAARMEQKDFLRHVLPNSDPSTTEPLHFCEPSSSTVTPIVPNNPNATSNTVVVSNCIFPSIEEIPTPEVPSAMAAAMHSPDAAPADHLLVPPATGTTTIRTPGDYILTRRLIAQPFDRWVQCQTCFDCFLQSNGYQTRRECPRCERHSMLYGFGWPKTEPDTKRLRELKEAREKGENISKPGGPSTSRGLDGLKASNATTGTGGQRGRGRALGGRGVKGRGRSGKSGKGSWVEGGGEDEREERVMDHRTVNRFIAPEEEREVRRRGRGVVLIHANRIPGGNAFGIEEPIPDQILPARIRGSNFNHALTPLAERARSSNCSTAREDSVGSGGGGGGGFVDEIDATMFLRRSKRYFA